MQAQTLAPSALFGNQVRYVVPLFQRPYIWTKDVQWDPVVERTFASSPIAFWRPSDDASTISHFLGAIVVEQAPIPVDFIAVWRIIDGQQRLTTLQLLLDAARVVTSKYGRPIDAQALGIMVTNPLGVTDNADERFKVWPTDRDQESFRAAMSAAESVPPALEAAPVVAAHHFFHAAITRWGKVNSPEETRVRLAALTRALHKHLMFVVISLAPADNAQVIFETLNHRGAPLLAADPPIKNLVFQVAQAQKKDVDRLYRTYWIDLDTDYWRQRIARGRQYVPRIDIFMNHWLIARLGREVPTDRIFATFRDHVVMPGSEPSHGHGATPTATVEHVEGVRLARPAVAVQRRGAVPVPGGSGPGLRCRDTGPAPAAELLGRTASDPRTAPRAPRDRESAGPAGAVPADHKGHQQPGTRHSQGDHQAAEPQDAGRAVEELLLSQTADSRFWPSDAMVRRRCANAALYGPRTQARVRIVLEAIEDQLRTGKGESIRCPRDLSIEHVMPRAWRGYWSSALHSDPAAVERRDKAIHTLGNLTLVTNRLNPAMSNRPWTAAEAKAAGLHRRWESTTSCSDTASSS